MVFTNALREAIRRSGLNPNQLENATGVLSESVSRFVRGEQSLRLDAADRLAAFLGVRATLPRPAERRPTVLGAKDYINAVVDEFNRAFPDAKIPHTGGHYATLWQFRVGEKIQVLFKRKPEPQLQVGIVCDANSRTHNREVASAYSEKLHVDIESGRIEDVPTSSGTNVGLLRRFPLSNEVPLGDIASRAVTEVRYILGRLGTGRGMRT